MHEGLTCPDSQSAWTLAFLPAQARATLVGETQPASTEQPEEDQKPEMATVYDTSQFRTHLDRRRARTTWNEHHTEAGPPIPSTDLEVAQQSEIQSWTRPRRRKTVKRKCLLDEVPTTTIQRPPFSTERLAREAVRSWHSATDVCK